MAYTRYAIELGSMRSHPHVARLVRRFSGTSIGFGALLLIGASCVSFGLAVRYSVDEASEYDGY